MANNFKNSCVSTISVDSANPTTVYVSNNGAACNSIALELDVANTGSATNYVSALLYDSSTGNSFYIAKDIYLPLGVTIKIINGQKIVLNGDDEIRVYGTDANADAIMSILEDVA